MILLVAVAGCSRLQPQATLKGRIFAITRNGDLKPARLANVYLLSSDRYDERYWIESWKSSEKKIQDNCDDLRKMQDIPYLGAASREAFISGVRPDDKLLNAMTNYDVK